MKKEITFEDYSKIQIVVGTVIKVSKNEKARKPSLVVKVDFGPEIGIKQSSAQITHYYNSENLAGKQVIGVCNFPKKNIAGVESEVLILGAIVQREFYEKRFGGGPPHLAKELAIPQAIKRGSLFLILLFAAVYGYQNWGRTEGILIGCLALWAAYGLYRTWIQAIATPKVKDLV